MVYFRGIIVAGYAGMITCGASMIAMASVRWGWQGAVVTSVTFLLSLCAIYKGGMHAMLTLGNGPKNKKRGSATASSRGSLLRSFPRWGGKSLGESQVTLQASQSA